MLLICFMKQKENRIEMLNSEFFHDVELTDAENKVLVWLCGFDDWTINILVKAFQKMRGVEK